jgi:hypothetical protein
MQHGCAVGCDLASKFSAVRDSGEVTEMNAKVILGAFGLVLIGLAVTVAPDLKRYLKIRAM